MNKANLTEKQRIALYEKVQKEFNSLVAEFKAIGDDVMVLDMFGRLFTKHALDDLLGLSDYLCKAKEGNVRCDDTTDQWYLDNKKISEARMIQLVDKYNDDAVKSVKNCQLLANILEEERVTEMVPPEGYKLVKITKKKK